MQISPSEIKLVTFAPTAVDQCVEYAHTLPYIGLGLWSSVLYSTRDRETGIGTLPTRLIYVVLE